MKSAPNRENRRSRSKKSLSPAVPSSPSPTPTPSVSSSESSVKRRRTTWNPDIEYEVERIVGYHRDKKNKMWYLIKWKGWSEEYNTFELIENLTSCNYQLMKYFECKKPSRDEHKAKKKEIDQALETHQLYKRLRDNGYQTKDLLEFSEKCLDIEPIFNHKKIEEFDKKIRDELKYIIRCLIGMYNHQDPGLFLRAQNYRICQKLISLRQKQVAKLSEREEFINSLEKVPIKVENELDFDVLPENFTYIVEMKQGDGVEVPKDPLLGCDCGEECNPKKNCCGKMADSVFAYTSTGKLRFYHQISIYECNWRCKCSLSCSNRVVQHGRKIQLCIFKTESCGWGVKTLENIAKGTYVCEYIGEIIPDSEAVVRDVDYIKRNDSYLFDLDFNPDRESDSYCIDSTNYGNVSRFINHSCDPNLVVYPVWVDCLEPNLHRLAFFARRNIKKFEEIHFDYENVTDETECEDDQKNTRLKMIAKVRCECKAAKCREWVFGVK